MISFFISINVFGVYYYKLLSKNVIFLTNKIFYYKLAHPLQNINKNELTKVDVFGHNFGPTRYKYFIL